MMAIGIVEIIYNVLSLFCFQNVQYFYFTKTLYLASLQILNLKLSIF